MKVENIDKYDQEQNGPDPGEWLQPDQLRDWMEYGFFEDQAEGTKGRLITL